MNRDEYNILFHRLELNLVAFKRLMDCDEEVLKLVNAAIEAEREWQGLTMEELDALVEEHSGWPVEMVGHVLICAAEDKLKGKNT